MVALNFVSKWYNTQVKVLDGIQFSLRKGEFLYIVGGTGTGKTTLLNLIAGNLRPSLGNISIFGINLWQCKQEAKLAVRRSIGFIPQESKLISDLSVFDNVALSLTLARRELLRSEVKDRICELLMKLGLAGKAKISVRELSGGEIQRVSVARALIKNPELILADEPTGSQDREYTWLLMDLFLKANANGATVILATHDRDIVRRIRKRSAILRGGQMSFEDPLCIY